MTSAAPQLDGFEPSALLRRLVAREDLSREETRALFDQIMEGRLDAALLAALLTALAVKGEHADEITGAVEALRARVTPVRLPPGATAIDTCGTGGDGKAIFNVSTTVALVVAAVGGVVAKHGNRSNMRPSGSAEVLQTLGIDVEAGAAALERCLAEIGLAFLYAPKLHPAMRHAAPVRRQLGIRTIFNLIGPLTNPAGVRRQLLGVNRPELLSTMRSALRALGAERAMIVHGCEGLCDLSLAGRSRIARWDGRQEQDEEIDCSVVGATPAPLETVLVRSPQESAAVIEGVLGGQPGPARDLVVLNAAAALWVAGLAADWREGGAAAREVLDSGRAGEVLAQWRTLVPRNCGDA